jgi:hypothetical protein
LSRRARAERRLDKRSADPRTGNRRAGESWAQEREREVKAHAARDLLETRWSRRLKLLAGC